MSLEDFNINHNTSLLLDEDGGVDKESRSELTPENVKLFSEFINLMKVYK